MKLTLALAAALISITTVAVLAQPKVRPTVTAFPTFACSATPDSATGGRATVTHENAVAVDKNLVVIATVKTPSGPESVSVCGAAFATEKQNRIAFPIKKAEKDFIYTCTARAGTSPCDKPLH
jgi:hypothetical protein